MRAYLALVVALVASTARAEIPADCTGWDHTPERAGYPPCISKCAKPGKTCKYAVGYIGGGCVGRKGDGWCPDEGTFGWDYTHNWRPGRVFLTWCHCRKQQPPGPYKTDGPHVPDIFSVHPIKDALSEKPECKEKH